MMLSVLLGDVDRKFVRSSGELSVVRMIHLQGVDVIPQLVSSRNRAMQVAVPEQPGLDARFVKNRTPGQKVNETSGFRIRSFTEDIAALRILAGFRFHNPIQNQAE